MKNNCDKWLEYIAEIKQPGVIQASYYTMFGIMCAMMSSEDFDRCLETLKKELSISSAMLEPPKSHTARIMEGLA